MHGWTLFAFAAVVALGPAVASPAAPSPAEASSGGDFVREAVIDGPVDLVWRLLTTEQGMESWLAPHAEVDLRVGGLVRTHQNPKGTIGDRQTLVNRVLALDPGKKLAFRVDRAPEGLPFGQFIVGTSYDVVLDPVSRDRTRVRCVGHGLPPGPVGFAIRPVFDRGAAMVLDELAKAVRHRPQKRAPG